MTIAGITAAAGMAAPGQATKLGPVVEKLAGTLWYNLLAEMSRTGLDTGDLGPGGDSYQNMFLWELSQKDFGKYDQSIVNATIRQVGGTGNTSPSTRAALGLMPDAAQAPLTSEAAALGGDGAEVDSEGAAALTQTLWPAVKAAASALGVPPIGVLAQAALETGWGTAAPGNNFFGIKAGGSDQAQLQTTHEMINGALVPELDSFRTYDLPQDSVSDYLQLIRSRFPDVIGQGSVEGFAQALQAGGFATDTNYAAKIIAIAHSPLMEQMMQGLAAGDGGSAP